MQKHSASAIIQKIQGGIFLWQDFLFLAKEYRAMEGGLAHAEAFCFCNHSKNPWMDFLNAGDLRGIGGAAKPLP